MRIERERESGIAQGEGRRARESGLAQGESRRENEYVDGGGRFKESMERKRGVEKQS